MNTVNLDNNYYFEIKNLIESDKSFYTRIEKIKFKNIKKNKFVFLIIDFKNFEENDYKRILRKFLFIKKLSIIYHFKLGIINDSKNCIGYLINYDANKKSHNDFISGVNAILYNSRYDMYNYIYDTSCNYLDSFFYGKNLCDFKDNQCGEKRGTSSLIGCCHHFKYKCLGPLSKLIPCEYLTKDYKCGAKCIGCKLFTCDYLEKKGIKFKIKDILLLDTFFNPIQKYFIKYMVFTPKEKVLKRLMLF